MPKLLLALILSITVCGCEVATSNKQPGQEEGAFVAGQSFATNYIHRSAVPDYIATDAKSLCSYLIGVSSASKDVGQKRASWIGGCAKAFGGQRIISPNTTINGKPAVTQTTHLSPP